MKIIQTRLFARAVKKLRANQKKDLDIAVKAIAENPALGDMTRGDLTGVHVYKFKMAKQLTLLAYLYERGTITLTLLALGSHENFYRDLKKAKS